MLIARVFSVVDLRSPLRLEDHPEAQTSEAFRPLISRELGEAEALTPEPSLRLAELSLFGAISMETVSITTDLICVNSA